MSLTGWAFRASVRFRGAARHLSDPSLFHHSAPRYSWRKDLAVTARGCTQQAVSTLFPFAVLRHHRLRIAASRGSQCLRRVLAARAFGGNTRGSAACAGGSERHSENGHVNSGLDAKSCEMGTHLPATRIRLVSWRNFSVATALPPFSGRRGGARSARTECRHLSARVERRFQTTFRPFERGCRNREIGNRQPILRVPQLRV